MSVGVDAEQVRRFEKFAGGAKPWRHVYSPREAGHLVCQPHAALAFCAAFCCKEALCKALGEAYVFPEFECFYRPGASEQEVVLSADLVERHALLEVQVRFDERFVAERGECVAEVHLFRRPVRRGETGCTPPSGGAPSVRAPLSRLETLAVAGVEAGRAQIVERHFAPREIADLGRRGPQSLAGFLALKRALVALWPLAGGAGATAPGDFELAHHASGAPRLVKAPEGVALADVLVSISHTRQWAYGLAVIRERLDCP